MMAIQLQCDARMILPCRAHQERHGISRSVDHGSAPHQNPDFEFSACFHKRAQKIAKLTTISMIRTQLDAAIKIPPDNQD